MLLRTYIELIALSEVEDSMLLPATALYVTVDTY